MSSGPDPSGPCPRPDDSPRAREAKLEALHETLREQVAALRSGADWKRCLQVASRFHAYSFSNTLAILSQAPDATAVAGYGSWKALGRQVNKGEHGIKILAPIVRRAPLDDSDPNGDPVDSIRRNTATAGNFAGAEIPGTPVAARVVGYRVAYVFDIAQTTGPPLPERPPPRALTGQPPPGLWAALTGVAVERGFTVQRGDCSANGYTNFDQRVILVRADLADAQAVKTLAHEVGHASMHDPSRFQGSTAGCRGTAEVEAESFAFLLAAAQGMDTSAYTFPYVTSWATDVDRAQPEAVVAATGQRVLAAAHAVLARLERGEDPRTVPALTPELGTAQAATVRAWDTRRPTVPGLVVPEPAAAPAPTSSSAAWRVSPPTRRAVDPTPDSPLARDRPAAEPRNISGDHPVCSRMLAHIQM